MTPAPPPSFDRVARIYRWAEYLTLGPLLQRTRTHFLAHLPTRARALVLGDGDGRFLAQLLHHQPHLHALAVDTSATMLHLLRQRCTPYADRLQTLQTSALEMVSYLSPENAEGAVAPDLVVTHFFLDCLTQPDLEALTHGLAAHLQPGTLWLLSDFAIPPKSLLKPLAALYIRALYLAFRLLTGLRVTHLPNPQTALQAAGFHRLSHHHRLCGLIYTEIWRYQ